MWALEMSPLYREGGMMQGRVSQQRKYLLLPWMVILRLYSGSIKLFSGLISINTEKAIGVSGRGLQLKW